MCAPQVEGAAMPSKTAGKRLADAREATGQSLNDVAFVIRTQLGKVLGISGEQLRKYEQGHVAEADWNPLVISVLAREYGKKSTRDLSTLAALELERLRHQGITQMHWIDVEAA
jgi:transcriptional regulator with XRE-family HTH domain